MFLYVCCLFLLSTSVYGSIHRSTYADQEKSPIASLTLQDYDFLKSGSGMALGGMAKAAELNGFPGPKHILEMKEQLELTSLQTKKIEDIFNRMNERSRKLGEAYLSLEAMLDQEFKKASINEEILANLVEKASELQGKLRLSHLQAHLESRPLLNEKQLKLYSKLRGYDEDPCKKVPEGHPKKMWLKHHGCQSD